MSYNRQKPYLSPEQVRSIMGIFKHSMTIFGFPYDDFMLQKTEEYVTSPKNIYENALISHVLDGRATFTCSEGLASFVPVKDAVIPSSPKDKKAADDREQLSYALYQIGHCGRKDAGRILSASYKPVVAEVVLAETEKQVVPAEVIDAKAKEVESSSPA